MDAMLNIVDGTGVTCLLGLLLAPRRTALAEITSRKVMMNFGSMRASFLKKAQQVNVVAGAGYWQAGTEFDVSRGDTILVYA